MPKIIPAFGAAVARLFQERGLTPRSARAITGINHMTLHEMRQGVVPSVDLLIRFCRKLGLSLAEWLRLAEYDELLDALAPASPTLYEEGETILLDGMLALTEKYGRHFGFHPQEPLTPESARRMLAELEEALRQQHEKEGAG